MRHLIPVLALFLAGTTGASGQSMPSEPAPGERVYARVDGRRVEGTLVALGDSVVIATASGESVARPRPAEIYRHTGHVSAWHGLLRGAAIGGAIGMGAGAILGYADGDDPDTMFIAFSAGEKAVLGGVTLGAAGIVLGGIVGAVTSGDRWQRVPLQPRVAVRPTMAGDRLVFGLEARF